MWTILGNDEIPSMGGWLLKCNGHTNFWLGQGEGTPNTDPGWTVDIGQKKVAKHKHRMVHGEKNLNLDTESINI